MINDWGNIAPDQREDLIRRADECLQRAQQWADWLNASNQSQQGSGASGNPICQREYGLRRQ